MSAPPTPSPLARWAATAAELIAAQAELAAAQVDRLTGVLSRPAWEAVATEWFERPPPALLAVFVDLDEVKHINDTQGHLAGDLLLRETGERLLGFLTHRRGIAGRLGGDEFGLLLPGGRADDLAELVTLLDQPIPRLGTTSLPAGASIGAVFADCLPTCTLSGAMERAEVAMRAHKRARARGRP